MRNNQELQFTDDEITLMMIYNPGTREGLIRELQQMQKQLTEIWNNQRALLKRLSDIR